MAQGEARRMSYKPGEKIPESLPVDDGTYSLNLNKYEKGEKGWKTKPGKFPSKKVTFSILDTEDEVTGMAKTVTEFVSLSPKILFRVMFIAQAAGYPEEFDLPKYGEKATTAPGVREAAAIVDAILDFIENEGCVMRANLGSEEYNGRTNNRIQKWLAPDEDGVAEAVEEAAEPASAFGDGGVEEGEDAAEEATEEAADAVPTAPVKGSSKVVPLGARKTAAPAKPAARKVMRK